MKNPIGTQCYSCLEQRDLTVEHVIPQALGGKLKSSLYCSPCNSDFGRTVDAELIQAFGYVGTNLRISRERGSNQPYEVRELRSNLPLMFDGRKLKRKNPIVKITKDGKDIDIDVTARSEKELDRIMGSIKSRYKLSSDGKKFKEGPEGTVDTSYARVLDSGPIRKAVSKMAYSLLCDRVPASGIMKPAFDDVRSYIRNQSENDMASANYTDHTAWTCDFVRPLHKIHISLNRGARLVTGFITIFGIFRFTVLLSNCYFSSLHWSPIDYTWDPVIQREVFGNPTFAPPVLSEAQILRPHHRQDLVHRELIRGYRMLGQYTDGFELLDLEFEGARVT